MKIEEIRIPAPWGHIAVKLWGEAKNPPILLLHGILDNAGAFDNLIPHLPANFYYICPDFPGHGRSAPFHLSLPVHITDYLVPTKMIADHFKREKYAIIGHSLGGQIGAFYAQLYPERVSKLVLLDALYLIPFNPGTFLEMSKRSITRLFKTIEQERSPRPVYTYEEAVEKVINGRAHTMMTRAAAVPIVERMFEKIGQDKYVMIIDSRLKDRLHPGTDADYLVRLHEEKSIECPVLAFISTDRHLHALLEPLYDLYVKRGYEMLIYEGHHDMHNTNPEVFASKIVKFLLNDSKLSKL